MFFYHQNILVVIAHIIHPGEPYPLNFQSNVQSKVSISFDVISRYFTSFFFISVRFFSIIIRDFWVTNSGLRLWLLILTFMHAPYVYTVFRFEMFSAHKMSSVNGANLYRCAQFAEKISIQLINKLRLMSTINKTTPQHKSDNLNLSSLRPQDI